MPDLASVFGTTAGLASARKSCFDCSIMVGILLISVVAGAGFGLFSLLVLQSSGWLAILATIIAANLFAAGAFALRACRETPAKRGPAIRRFTSRSLRQQPSQSGRE